MTRLARPATILALLVLLSIRAIADGSTEVRMREVLRAYAAADSSAEKRRLHEEYRSLRDRLRTERARDAAGAGEDAASDPFAADLEALRARAGDLAAFVEGETARLTDLALEKRALAGIAERLGESGVALPEDLAYELTEVDRRMSAARESELPALEATERVLEDLFRAAGEFGVDRDAVERRRTERNRELARDLPILREAEAEIDRLRHALAQREGFLAGSSDRELDRRERELEAALPGLDARDAAVARRELEDLRAERSRRDEARRSARDVEDRARTRYEDEILPEIDRFRASLAAAAGSEDVGVVRTLIGRVPLLDRRRGAVDPAAFEEDSLFGRIHRLPEGATRTRAALAFLTAAREFSSRVAPTIEDSVVGDGTIPASFFNSGPRADLRLKAASLLAEEAADLVRLTNDREADPEDRDRNGERLTRFVESILDPGTTTIGGEEARTLELVRGALASAIARTAAAAIEAQERLRELRSGLDPEFEALSAPERARALESAEDAVVQAAQDLGHLLGAIEAGQARALESVVAREKEQEETIKAFLDLAFAVGTAPLPGGSALTGEAMSGKILDTLVAKAGEKMGSAVASGHPDTRRRLEANLRRDVRSYRDLAESLLDVTRTRNVSMGEVVANARDRVAGDRLNQPGVE